MGLYGRFCPSKNCFPEPEPPLTYPPYGDKECAGLWQQEQEPASKWLYDSSSDLYYWLDIDNDGNYVRVYEGSENQGTQQGGSSGRKSASHPRTDPSRSSKQSDRKQKSASSSKRPDPIPEKTSRSKNTHRKQKEYHDKGGYDTPRNNEPADYPTTRAPQSVTPLVSSNNLEDYRKASATNAYPEDSTYPEATEGSQDPERSSHEAEELGSGMGSLTLDEVVGAANYPLSTGHQNSSASRPNQSRRETEPSQRTTHNTRSKKDTSKIKPKATEDPHLQLPVGRFIASTPGEFELLDPAYKRRNKDWKKFFDSGRVFSTLWTDPAGNVSESEANQFTSVVTFGELVHSKIRRFVVVRQVDRCCICLPVTTYSGRGTMKPGLNLSHHGLIYGSDLCPPSENGITKRPLKVKLGASGTLGDPSYINYGRLYTIDCNVKVKNVGDLDSDSRKLLKRYYNLVNILQEDDGYDEPMQGLPDNANDLTGVGYGMMAQYPSNVQAQGPYPGYNYADPGGYSNGYVQPQDFHQPASGWQNNPGMTHATYPVQPLYTAQSFQGHGGMHNSTQPNVAWPPSTPSHLERSQSYVGHQQYQDKRSSHDHTARPGPFNPSSPLTDQSSQMHHGSISSQDALLDSSPITQSSPAVATSQTYHHKFPVGASQASIAPEHTDPYADQEHSAPDEVAAQGTTQGASSTPVLVSNTSQEEAVDDYYQGGIEGDVRLVANVEEAKAQVQSSRRHRHDSTGARKKGPRR